MKNTNKFLNAVVVTAIASFVSANISASQYKPMSKEEADMVNTQIIPQRNRQRQTLSKEEKETFRPLSKEEARMTNAQIIPQRNRQRQPLSKEEAEIFRPLSEEEARMTNAQIIPQRNR